MCSTCGCGHGNVRIDGKPVDDAHEAHEDHWHQHEDGSWHSHAHEHRHAHPHGHKHHHPHHHDGGHDRAHHHDHSNSAGPLGAVHASGVSTTRMIEVERDILEKNDALAQVNRQQFADQGVFALNLVSSPGSGKTTLLVRTLEALKNSVSCAVIEGDQQTENDAERVRATGIPAVQINTGKGCHLDARMVAQALPRLPRLEDALLFIENVGNLVCPAAFDLGEAHKVAILSVTEGTDKPRKYPDIFHAADVLLINKIDLLPYVDFDVEQAITYARQIQPKLIVMQLSSTSGEGMDTWLSWLRKGVDNVRAGRQNDIQALRQKIAALEAQLRA